MSAFSTFLGRVFEISSRKRLEKDAIYPDASKAIEGFNTRLAQRIAAQRARNRAAESTERSEQLASS